MSDSFREHVLSYLDAGVRFDGRKLDEFRPVSVEYGISRNAEGSARVIIGSTHVLAGVKMAVEKPYPDTPQNGNLMVNVELLPLSNPDYEAGPPSEEAVEIAKVNNLPVIDSLIYTSALKNNSQFITLDNDFKELNNVLVLKK